MDIVFHDFTGKPSQEVFIFPSQFLAGPKAGLIGIRIEGGELGFAQHGVIVIAAEDDVCFFPNPIHAGIGVGAITHKIAQKDFFIVVNGLADLREGL